MARRNYNLDFTSVRSDCKNMCPCGKMSNYKCKTYHPETDLAYDPNFYGCTRKKKYVPDETPDGI